MPIPTELREVGTRVSYCDMANPRRVGEVVGLAPLEQYAVRWEDGSESVSDLRQHGWHLVASDIRVTDEGIDVGLFHGADIISIYTRAQALEDGALVDVSTMAREAGFVVPVALTRAAWAECVEWTHGGFQSESGRLWDVLFMARSFGGRRDTDRVAFTVLRVPNSARATRTTKAHLVAVCGPGDMAEPVVTIMLPGDD